MPRQALRPCNAVGCNRLSEYQYCEDHSHLGIHDTRSMIRVNSIGLMRLTIKELLRLVGVGPICKI